MLNSIEYLYNLNKTYIFPLLKFANIYVDDLGILRPCNADPTLSYQYEGKDLIIISTQAQLVSIKDKKEEYEIFNPLLVPRHCVFLANMVTNTANLLSDSLQTNKNSKMKYDEDLDEYISDSDDEDEVNGLIRMFHAKNAKTGETNKISFSFTDSSGNPKGDELASYSDYNAITATIGAVINLIKLFQKNISPNIHDTETTMDCIDIGVVKYQKLKEDEKKVKTSIVDLSIDDEDTYEDIKDADAIDYYIDPILCSDTDKDCLFMWYDKRDQYDPENAESKLIRNLLVPKYKTIYNKDDMNGDKSMAEQVVEVQSQINSLDLDLSW